MPLFSVVVPVYRVQGYLRECLESVLNQSCGDFELIVVDDHSPDACGAIAAEYAERDARVRLLSTAAHAGTGAARNAGAGQACGRHLLFLDGDDILLPGALEAVADRLATAGEPEPDLLLLGHDSIDWWGDVHPAGVSFDDPLGATPAAWNRVFRRDFFVRHGLRFPDGPYGDVLPVHQATLLAADNTAVLDEVCVRWRERRSGSVSTTPGRHHFAITEQYAYLLAATPDAADRARLFPYMIRHLLAVLTDPGRIAAPDRADFFRAVSDHYRTHRPDDYQPPAGEAGPRHRALAAGSYAAFRAVRAADSGLAHGRAVLGAGKKALRRQVLRTAYRADLHRPLDPDLAVYGAYWNRGVSCNPAAIHRKARELAPHIRGVWVVGSRYRDRLPEGTDHVIEGSRGYWQVMARATYLVNNSGFPGGFTKRPGQIYLQTHHGTPLKTMGLDQRRYPAGGHGISFAKVLDHADQWDYSLSANQHSTEVWERVYPSTYEALNLGYPRNDVYFTSAADDIARIRAGLGIEPGQRAVLYAPTHRDYQQGFHPRLDLARFADLLGPSCVLLVRAHYYYREAAHLAPRPRTGHVIDVTDHPSTEELALAADVLITDYSSLMFDYACLDRPVVVYAPDWQAYRLSRGTYLDPLSGRLGDTPGAIATSEPELRDLFRHDGWDTDATAKLREAFRARFCPYEDGRAAERVVRRVFG
ncbi:CDP-glycerol glycerophosphotransferase family protein [Streptomyces sp. A3M-1-3]|uniref:bifunctional glycosyltransferase/CDP-glycerol:glycerophosphate glycerophosphotransferase n=1 Tax=Streptomyces sp. A3M-1-3 TaxID=2962044 RepID=UPI0020B680A3|nr:bifunctional glycosyltransferase family 2 protein/CDP-glycerol:glycerophosphate glycerophosphotransferase [Streptomyces sp. A3M-1-3]MCP3822165.1 CDP-glycerol glycerophosphotransferase family protein [Streptomyces sp. A3M-1-3]